MVTATASEVSLLLKLGEPGYFPWLLHLSYEAEKLGACETKVVNGYPIELLSLATKRVLSNITKQHGVVLKVHYFQ